MDHAKAQSRKDGKTQRDMKNQGPPRAASPALRRPLFAPLRLCVRPLALALLGAVLLLGATAVGAQTPKLSVLPGSASQFQTLSLTGENFTPGAALWVTFVSPSG